MKKKAAFILLVMTLFVMTSFLSASTTNIEMYLWNRLTYVKSGDEVIENQFSLARGYLRINHAFSSNISGRFNIDVFSSDKDDDANGAGLKLKYAYLDFKKLIPIKDSKLTVGLMKTYFGTIYDWSYITVAKAPSDLYKICSSTDYGIGVYGYLPSGFGEYALAMYNGEGYKKTGDAVNKYPAFVGNIRVTPITGLTIGGSAFMANKVGDSEPYDKKTVYAGVGRFVLGPIDIWAEYISQEKTTNSKTESKTKSAGFMVMPVVKLFPNFELVFRYDQWDPNTDQDNDKKNLLLAGFNWYIARRAKGKPAVMLQVNYEKWSYESSKSEDTNKLFAQLRWEFATPKF